MILKSRNMLQLNYGHRRTDSAVTRDAESGHDDHDDSDHFEQTGNDVESIDTQITDAFNTKQYDILTSATAAGTPVVIIIM